MSRIIANAEVSIEGHIVNKKQVDEYGLIKYLKFYQKVRSRVGDIKKKVFPVTMDFRILMNEKPLYNLPVVKVEVDPEQMRNNDGGFHAHLKDNYYFRSEDGKNLVAEKGAVLELDYLSTPYKPANGLGEYINNIISNFEPNKKLFSNLKDYLNNLAHRN
jgi:hypothetical protein